MFTTLGILYVVLGLFVIVFLVSQCQLVTLHYYEETSNDNDVIDVEYEVLD